MGIIKLDCTESVERSSLSRRTMTVRLSPTLSKLTAVHRRKCSKRVRFDTASKECSKAASQTSESTYSLSNETRHLLWWNAQSLAASRRDDSAQATHYCQFDHADSLAYQQALLILWKSFATPTTTSPQHVRYYDGLARSVHTVTQANVRGLEHRIVPLLKLARKLSAQAILRLQDELRHKDMESSVSDSDSCDSVSSWSDQSTILLRQQSLQSSRSARQLAYRLAQADFLEAQRIYQESAVVVTQPTGGGATLASSLETAPSTTR